MSRIVHNNFLYPILAMIRTDRSNFTRYLIGFVTILVLGWGLTGLTNHASAQSTHLTSVNLGLGGGGAAYIDGYHSNFINPANIGINRDVRPNFTLGLFWGLGMNAGGPLANVGAYNKYMTKGLVLNEVADQMYGEIFGGSPANFKSLGMNFNMVPIGMAYRRDDWAVSLSTRLRFMTDLSANRGFFEFLTHGLDGDEFSEATPASFNMKMLTMSEVSLGGSMHVLESNLGDFAFKGADVPVDVYAGIAPKLLIGHNSMGMNFNSNITVGDEQVIHDFNYGIRTVGEITNQFNQYYVDHTQRGMSDVSLGDYIEPEGGDFYKVKSFGMGLDLGATAEFDLSNVEALDIGSFFKGKKFARVALSVTDIGQINMSTDAGKFTHQGEFVWEGFEYDQERINAEFDSSFSNYTEHVTDSIANNVYLNYTPEEAGEISNDLPTMFHLGTQFQMGRAGLMFDIARGFTKRGMTNKSTTTALGLEYKTFGVWPLRVGIRTGGMGSTSYSFGTGIELRNFELSFSAMSVNDSSSNGYYIAGALSGLVFHF